MDGVLKIKKSHPNAVVPKRATGGSAAMDLSAALNEPVTINPGEIALISTGIAIELPSDQYVALLISRSSLGVKNGLSLINSVGVIDSDYRGIVHVGLINHAKQPFTIQNGDRIAQLLITNALTFSVQEVQQLSDTARGDGGFGSTGI